MNSEEPNEENLGEEEEAEAAQGHESLCIPNEISPD